MAELPWKKLVRPIQPARAMVRGQGPARPEKLLTQMAALMLAQAQKAFADEKLGNVSWKERYPNQPWGAKLNVAGAIEDLKNGPNIKERRFVPRPVLSDRGTLRRSLAARSANVKLLGMWMVEVGTVVPYAGVHQWGGTSRVNLTEAVKINLWKWVQATSKKVERLKAWKPVKLSSRNGGTVKSPAANYADAMKLSKRVQLVQHYIGSLVTKGITAISIKHPARPFLGWTDDLGKKVQELMLRNLGGARP